MRENCTSGSARGVPGNRHSYRRGATSTLAWRKEAYYVDIHALSTFHNPITYRFLVAQGAYLNDQNQRVCPTFYTAFCHDCEYMSLTY